MPIEALYPYAIMTYSAFVTILAVYLWKLTNLNVDGTRHNIEKQVATAVTDIQARLDAKLDELPDMVGTHVSMAIKGVQATEGKAIAKYVEELGIEGITEEAKEAAVERLTAKQRIAYQLMTMKVPSKTKRDHPVSTMVFEQSRGLVAQQLIESEQRESGNVTYDNGGPARSRTFNPGYNP
jgi:hypothetical protein